MYLQGFLDPHCVFGTWHNRLYHTTYHRLVGLCLLETTDSLEGGSLVVPMPVDPLNWLLYEVDHGGPSGEWNNLDCTLANLKVRLTALHRGEGRLGWNKRSRTHSQKVSALRRRPARGW